MASQFAQGNIQIKTSLLIFLKGSVAPIVLYFEDPKKVYDDLQKVLKAASAPKMVELDASGPIKKVSLVSTEISGLALQEEQYMVKQ
ncbi:MAG: hypothetical protein OSJ27_06630 [Candidatus Gastranaerophilales bacterium]|nr:hypothetical protein [Candidatus Gastranaerophilales bacterium]